MDKENKMMKKIFLSLLVMLLATTITGCDIKENSMNKDIQNDSNNAISNATSNSLTYNTRKIIILSQFTH